MTFDKQDGLSAILGQHIATVKAILSKSTWAAPRYHYIDMTAGCGHNEEIDCPGSPVIFQKAIRAARLSYDAHFIDIEPTNTMVLCGAIRADKRITIHTGDHAEIAPQIVQGWPDAYAYGMIYSDTNGVPPFDLLADLSHNPKLKRIDFLIRYTGAGVKRAGYRLLDELARIDKEFWIVRDLDNHDRWQWTFLLGLNWNGLNVMRDHGFHYAHSDRGQEIVERLHYTKPELAAFRQPELSYLTYREYLDHPTYKVIRQQAIDRSSGMCERCHERPVTEVHHLQYPPWGTFEENADYLLAVCHRCHCQIHNKKT